MEVKKYSPLNSLKKIAEESDVVITMLPNSPQVKEVINSGMQYSGGIRSIYVS